MEIGTTGVTLSGMADRIDILKTGGAEIVDYKSGGTPTRKQARAMLDPQLALEAAALQAGGFATVGAMEPVSLKYIRLKGGDALKVDALEGGDRANGKNGDDTYRSAADLGSEAILRLAGLIELLASGRRGFASQLIPLSAREFGGDYDHLARVAEWSSAEEGESGEGAEA
jgi:ATP-dependent helicase/nuclease subunit B